MPVLPHARVSPSLVAVVWLTFVCTLACFRASPRPATFRFQCTNGGDCRDNEQCIDGLCQIPCTQFTFEQACTASEGYVACINGECSHGCKDDDDCPRPHECVQLELESVGMSLGWCAQPCGNESVCPQSEQCLQGLCAVSCANDTDCPSGLVCEFGICIPDLPGQATDPTTGTDTGGTDTKDDDGPATTTGTSDTTGEPGTTAGPGEGGFPGTGGAT